MANLPISGLTASASNLASADVTPVVQTTGVGPVKMTGLQLAGGLLGSATFNGATVTTSQPVLNLSQTWNAGAVTFTGLQFNATDTASAAASLLLDLQTGGSSKLTVNKAGIVRVGTGTSFQNNVGIYSPAINVGDGASAATNFAGNQINIWNSNVNTVSVNNSGFRMASSGNIGFGSLVSTADTFLSRAAAASLQLGAADAAAPVAQTLQVQSVVSGSPANTAGANFTIKGSAGNGSGAGGSIIFQVAPAGTPGVTAQNTYATALTIDSTRTATFAGSILIPVSANSTIAGIANPTSTNSGFYTTNGADYGYTRAGSAMIGFRFQALTVSSGSTIGFTSSASDPLGTQDVFLARDAANTLALRNGAAAQTFNVYNTYTDASNYERAALYWSSNSAWVEAQAAGTGTLRSLNVNGLALNLRSGGTLRWQIDTSGHFIAGTDNTYDIGASGASRPRNVYVAGNVVAGGSLGLQLGNGAAPIYWSGRSQIYSPANGNVQLTNSSTNDFDRLQFGGTTSSFPAIKRSGATLAIRLADDSADAALSASQLTASSTTANTSAIASTGYSLTGTSAVNMVDLAGTWNTTGVPTGIKLNITNTASGAGSLLLDLQVGAASKFKVDKNGSTICGSAAVATTATDGFLYIPTCAGTPTGVPTTQTGTAAMVADSTNNKLYVYLGGAWVAMN